jgi:low temperature requirement protein LtrA
MRPGMGHLIVGVVLLSAGIAVTFSSTETVWYGAIVVGLIEIARGLYYLLRARQ